MGALANVAATTLWIRSNRFLCLRCCVTSAPKECTSTCRAASGGMPLALRKHSMMSHGACRKFERSRAGKNLDVGPSALHWLWQIGDHNTELQCACHAATGWHRHTSLHLRHRLPRPMRHQKTSDSHAGDHTSDRAAGKVT